MISTPPPVVSLLLRDSVSTVGARKCTAAGSSWDSPDAVVTAIATLAATPDGAAHTSHVLLHCEHVSARPFTETTPGSTPKLVPFTVNVAPSLGFGSSAEGVMVDTTGGAYVQYSPWYDVRRSSAMTAIWNCRPRVVSGGDRQLPGKRTSMRTAKREPESTPGSQRGRSRRRQRQSHSTTRGSAHYHSSEVYGTTTAATPQPPRT